MFEGPCFFGGGGRGGYECWSGDGARGTVMEREVGRGQSSTFQGKGGGGEKEGTGERCM